MTNYVAKLAKGSAWITSSRAVMTLLTFASTILLARLLMPEDFGLVALATTMLAILTAITDVPVGSALVQHRDPTEDHYHTAWSMNVVRGALLALALCAAAVPMAYIYEDQRLVSIMFVLAGSALLTGFGSPRLAFLERNLLFHQDFVLNVASKLSAVIISIALALLTGSYWALILGNIAGQVLQLILSYVLAPGRPRFTFRYARDLWSFSAWMSLTQIVNTVNYRLDPLLIGGVLGPSTLGQYAVGDRLASAPTRELISPLMRTAFPAFSRFSENEAKLRSAYQRTQALCTALALPIGVQVAIVAEPLVLLTMGAKWLPAVPVIQGLAAIFAIQTLGSLAQPLAMARGQTRALFIRSTWIFLLRVPLVLVGMYLAGLQGAVYARIISGLTAILINMRLVSTLVRLPMLAQLLVNTRAMTSVCVMTAALLLAQEYLEKNEMTSATLPIVLALMVAGVAVYVLAMLAQWIAFGRPQGAETEIAGLIKHVRERLLKGRSPA